MLCKGFFPPSMAFPQGKPAKALQDTMKVKVLKVKALVAQSLSCVQLFATTWTVAHQAPLSMAFSRQEYWSG